LRAYQSTKIVSGLQAFDVRICTMIDEVKTSMASSCPACNDRIGNKVVCKNEECKKEFSSFKDKEIIKGYEISKGDIHNLSDENIEELKNYFDGQMNVKGTIPLSKIDYRTIIGGVYLAPAKSKKKADQARLEKMFVVLRDGLFKSKKAIVVEYSIRSKQKLGLLIPFNDTIIVKQIAYGVELREFDESYAVELSADELELGTNFVTALKEIDPLEIEHQWSTKMEELLKGEPMTVAVAEPKDDLGFFK
jgi:DNA end-binding protein Ku